MRNRVRSTTWPVVVLALTLAACGGSARGGPYGSGDPSLAAANLGGGPIDPFLSDGQAVLHALDAIAVKSGTPMRVTSMMADSTNGLTVNVQEPQHHLNVDSYVVAPDGTISGPTPVRLMSLGGGPITAASVDAQAFDPHGIGFARLTQTVREAIAKSGYTDARISEWEIAGIGADDRRFLYFQAARGRPAAAVRPDLSIARMSY